MINLIKADFYKINRSAIYKILFLVSAVCAIVTTVVSHLIYTEDLSLASASSAAMLTDVVMLNLINCVVAGQLICGDFDNKLIQSALTGSSGRFTIVCAKMITYTVVVGIMTIPYALSGIIGFCLDLGYGTPYSASTYLKILFEANTVDFSASVLLKYIAIAVIMMLVYSAQSGITFVLAFIMKNKALLVTAIGFIISTIIGMGTSLIAGDGTNDILSWTPYSSDIYSLCSESEIATLFRIILVCVMFIAVYTGISYAAFKKAEIK